MKKLLRITLVLLGLLCIAGIGGSLYLQWYALQAEGNSQGKDIDASYRRMTATYPMLAQWTDSLREHRALRDTFITADDGTRLHALYLYADTVTEKTAVVVHGYTDNAVEMLHIGYMYNHDLHYNVLLPDLRFSGLSEGTHLQMGWHDRMDVLRWMDVANELFGLPRDGTNTGKQTQMVVHGISMGGATVLCVSGEPQKPYVKCFVDDCGYTSVWDEYEGELKNRFGLPAFPVLYIASWLTDLRYGWNFQEASPLQQVKRSLLPILFIHGDADTFVPTWMGDSLYAAKSAGGQYWKVPGTAHAQSYRNYPTEYTEKVQKFVEQYIR